MSVPYWIEMSPLIGSPLVPPQPIRKTHTQRCFTFRSVSERDVVNQGGVWGSLRLRMSNLSGPLLTHDLARHYAALRAIRSRVRLYASPLWAEIGPEVERILDAVERGHHDADPPGPTFRVVAWNIQRGVQLDALR